MKLRLAVIACVLTLLAAAPPAQAEVRVTAHVDRTTVAPGESLMLRVTIQGGKGEVDLSDITDFEVLSRGSGSNYQIVNGKMSREFTYNYLLIPKSRGRLNIPALTVEVEGRRHRTKPVSIQVAARSAEGAHSAGTDVRVEAEVSNSTPVQGQLITYTFRYFRAVQTDDARFQPPEFHGLAAKEIENQRSFRKIINGREHAVTEVFYVLTPIEAGAHTIKPATLRVGIVRRQNSRGRSPFDGIFGRRSVEQRVLQTESIDLQVRPLPAWQGSPPFSGLVGRFDLTATIESTDLKVGDSATLTLTIQGHGNLMDARAPALQLPAAVKQYTDNPEDEIQLDSTGYSGKKVFRTALVPVAAGEIKIEPIRLVYFDTEENRYRTLTATAPPLSVSAADANIDALITISANPLSLAKQRVAFTGRDILPPKESLTAVRSRAPFSGWLFILAVAAPAMVYGGTVLTQRFCLQEKTPAAIMKARSRRALKLAVSRTDETQLGHLYQALTAAILAAAGRTGEALTWKEAEAMLIRQDRPPEVARQAAGLLSKIESCKFANTRIDEAKHAMLLDQTRKMIRTLAK